MITLYLMMGCTVSGNYIYINIAWESVYAILLELITSKLILRSSVSYILVHMAKLLEALMHNKS